MARNQKMAAKLEENQVMTITADGKFSVSEDYAVAERFISRRGDVIPVLISKAGRYLVSINALLKSLGYKNPSSTIGYHFNKGELVTCKMSTNAGEKPTRQYFASPCTLTGHSSSVLSILHEYGLSADIQKHLLELI